MEGGKTTLQDDGDGGIMCGMLGELFRVWLISSHKRSGHYLKTVWHGWIKSNRMLRCSTEKHTTI